MCGPILTEEQMQKQMDKKGYSLAGSICSGCGLKVTKKTRSLSPRLCSFSDCGLPRHKANSAREASSAA